MTMTEPSTAARPTGDTTDTGPRLFGPRGRHRRPRPRKVLLAAGGLALAAGALSLVRMAPDTGVGGLGTAEAEDRENPGTSTDTTDRATNAAATVGTIPKVSPSATSVMGRTSTTPSAGVSLAPTPSATAAQQTPTAITTTIPEAPNTLAPTGTPHPPTTSTAPQPAPTPGRTTPPPAPQPSHPDQPAPNDPGLCVPVIGLCVNGLAQNS